MDPKLVALLAVKVAGQATGQTALVELIERLHLAYTTGENIDKHMDMIAERLEMGTPLDQWTDIMAKLDAEVDEFLNRGESGSAV